MEIAERGGGRRRPIDDLPSSECKFESPINIPETLDPTSIGCLKTSRRRAFIVYLGEVLQVTVNGEGTLEETTRLSVTIFSETNDEKVSAEEQTNRIAEKFEQSVKSLSPPHNHHHE